MAQQLQLARPYANAALKVAVQDKTLQQWSQALQGMALVMANKQAVDLLGQPNVNKTQIADLIIDIVGQDFDQKQKNFVYLLAENKRLEFVPTIAELYEQLRADYDNRAEVVVTCAVELSQEQKQALEKALEKRLSAGVDVDYQYDESILGGAIVRVGDQVIDHSLRTQLDLLKREIAR